jgi:hypothetical protein
MRIAYCALHYGKEYLAWAVRSVQESVDQFHVLYTERPSYGHPTNMTCPDSEEELFAEAHRFSSIPIVWHRGHWTSEGDHRNAIYKVAETVGASQVLVVDADEIWQPGQVEKAFVMADGIKSWSGTCGVNMVHLWRSFNWVNVDHWMPIRVLNVGYSGPQGFLSGLNPVIHAGYAQSVALTRYKWSCHGHQAELRPNWLEEKFIGWKPGDKDVHPTTIDIWNPERRGFEIAPLHDHPYARTEVIG